MKLDDLKQFADDETKNTGDVAIRAIDKLIVHLHEQRANVVAWRDGKSAKSTPAIYGNAVNDAVDAVADFRATAELAARIKGTS